MHQTCYSPPILFSAIMPGPSYFELVAAAGDVSLQSHLSSMQTYMQEFEFIIGKTWMSSWYVFRV